MKRKAGEGEGREIKERRQDNGAGIRRERRKEGSKAQECVK